VSDANENDNDDEMVDYSVTPVEETNAKVDTRVITPIKTDLIKKMVLYSMIFLFVAMMLIKNKQPNIPIKLSLLISIIPLYYLSK
jgi:hypothetical protein